MKKGRGRVLFYIFMAALMFSSMEATCKMAAAGLNAYQLTAVRFFIGGLVLLPFALWERRGKRAAAREGRNPAAAGRISVRDHLWMLLLGVFCIPVSMLLFQLGVEFSNASTAAVLFCVNSLFTAVLAHFFAGEMMTRRKAFAFAVSLVGITMMIRPWALQEGNSVKGFACTLLGALAFSTYTILGKKSIPRLGNTFQTSLSFLYGAGILLLLMRMMHRPVLAGLSGHPVLLAYIGIAVTGIGYLSYFKAIEHSDATTGSITFLLKPVMAPLIAMILLGETILWNSWIGILLILVASLINLLENRAQGDRRLQGSASEPERNSS